MTADERAEAALLEQGRTIASVLCGMPTTETRSGMCDRLVGRVVATPAGAVVVTEDRSAGRRERRNDRKAAEAFARGERVYIGPGSGPDRRARLLGDLDPFAAFMCVCAEHGLVWISNAQILTDCGDETGPRRKLRAAIKNPNATA